MSFALAAGVTGLQAHQKMLDIAGNNLANVNTTAYKSSRITFSELLSETIKKASQPTSTVGGTNPQQMGSGVGISGISPNMMQGNIVNTGNPLDMAIEGEGYFVVSDGSQSVYTRSGAFAVDANSNLVDPSTGYIVQRIGSLGESDGFQTPGSSNARVPYDVAMAAKGTSSLKVAGNLSANAELSTPQTNVIKSDINFTTNNGANATGTTELDLLDQFTANGGTAAGTITFSGYDSDGTAFSASATTPKVALTMNVSGTTTLNDILNKLNGTTGGAATSEVQTFTVDAAATAGTSYTMTVGGQTATILRTDDATTIQTKLEALSTVGTGDIVVAGDALSVAINPLTFTFKNTAGDVGMISFDINGLTGPTQAGSTMAETTKGIAAAGSGILGTDAVASLSNGRIVITNGSSGYSQSDIKLAYTSAGNETLTMPGYFEITSVGGDEIKNINITVYDSQGGAHVLSGAFVRTDTTNTWDMVLSSISGDVDTIDISGNSGRRIKGIEFDASDGSFSGLNHAIGDTSTFKVTFAHDTASPQTISLSLGTSGQLDGLTQFAGNSTAVAREQDGYESGRLSTVSVNNEGILIGAFSNGIKKNLATLQVALFQNTAGLETIGNGYYTPSANSGEAVATQALSGGAGSIHGGSLEKSNADVATEFVSMIQAQNGFQANARTIRVANDVLRELTNLIR
jgi:flagellar hook protein FlgE